jgi:hypothetical protein
MMTTSLTFLSLSRGSNSDWLTVDACFVHRFMSGDISGDIQDIGIGRVGGNRHNQASRSVCRRPR